LALVKLGHSRISVWDDDTVESLNVPSQLYGSEDKECYKVDALNSVTRRLCGIGLRTHTEKYKKENPDVVIIGVDSMEARKAIVEESTAPLIIEGRFSSQYLELFKVGGDKERKEWLRRWYSDEEAENVPCGAKAIVDVGMMTGALIANTLRRCLSGDHVPFCVGYDAGTGVQVFREEI